MCKEWTEETIKKTLHNSLKKLGEINDIDPKHWDCSDIDNVKDLLKIIDISHSISEKMHAPTGHSAPVVDAKDWHSKM